MRLFFRLAVVVLSVGLGLGLAACGGPPPARPADGLPAPVAVPPAPVQSPSVATQPVARTSADQDQPVLVGTVTSVTDGDTIKVQLASGPITVRMGSIDAPEKSQPWGREAYAELTKRLNRQVVSLEIVEQDRYERVVAVVYLGDENVNAWMVQQGNAWAYRQYLGSADYCQWEADARRMKLGLWSLPPASWYAPWEWRRAQRGDGGAFTDYSAETAERCAEAARRGGPARVEPLIAAAAKSTQPPAGRCLIKGNISDSGRIYHVPGSAFYERTVIDESAGERWFCTEAEALSAGWRAPRTAATR